MVKGKGEGVKGGEESEDEGEGVEGGEGERVKEREIPCIWKEK